MSTQASHPQTAVPDHLEETKKEGKEIAEKLEKERQEKEKKEKEAQEKKKQETEKQERERQQQSSAPTPLDVTHLRIVPPEVSGDRAASSIISSRKRHLSHPADEFKPDITDPAVKADSKEWAKRHKQSTDPLSVFLMQQQSPINQASLIASVGTGGSPLISQSSPASSIASTPEASPSTLLLSPIAGLSLGSPRPSSSATTSDSKQSSLSAALLLSPSFTAAAASFSSSSAQPTSLQPAIPFASRDTGSIVTTSAPITIQTPFQPPKVNVNFNIWGGANNVFPRFQILSAAVLPSATTAHIAAVVAAAVPSSISPNVSAREIKEVKRTAPAPNASRAELTSRPPIAFSIQPSAAVVARRRMLDMQQRFSFNSTSEVKRTAPAQSASRVTPTSSRPPIAFRIRPSAAARRIQQPAYYQATPSSSAMMLSAIHHSVAVIPNSNVSNTAAAVCSQSSVCPPTTYPYAIPTAAFNPNVAARIVPSIQSRIPLQRVTTFPERGEPAYPTSSYSSMWAPGPAVGRGAPAPAATRTPIRPPIPMPIPHKPYSQAMSQFGTSTGPGPGPGPGFGRGMGRY
ncbi:MAG: hypothetical protein M1561_00550 [Gammaproteobacteria bacterium]|nr:hypothetical protein [Gammaproteobacteria bacterium]